MNYPLADLAFASSARDHATISHDSLCRLFAELGLRHEPSEIDRLFQLAHVSQTEDPGPPFEIRMGGWQLDLPTAIARGVTNGTVLGALLAATGQASVPATVLSVVVPFIFDLQRVNISRSDKVILAALLQDPWGREPIDVWYDKLPSHVREELSSLEFVDVIERLEDAGLVDVDDWDVATIKHPSQRRLARLNLPGYPGVNSDG